MAQFRTAFRIWLVLVVAGVSGCSASGESDTAGSSPGDQPDRDSGAAGHDGGIADGAGGADAVSDMNPAGDSGADGGVDTGGDSSPPITCTHYVAKNGKDTNTGTELEPWLTIQHAADVLVAGQTVCIKAGTYKESVAPKNSGTTGGLITYAAFPGDEVILDGQGVTTPQQGWGGLFHIANRSYIRVVGLNVNNSSVAGVFVGSSHFITVERNRTNNTYQSGIGVWQSGDILVDSNEVVLACNDGDQECITVAQTDGFEVRGNHVHNTGPGSKGGEGIDAKDGSSNGTVHHNHVHDIPNRLCIYVDSWDKHEFNIQVFSNTAHDCGGNAYAVASENGGLLENVRLFNNVGYRAKHVGLTVAQWGEPVPHHPIKDLWIVNNTFWNNGTADWGGGIDFDNSEAQNVVIRNNIVSQNKSFQIAIESQGGSPTIDHNLIDGFRNYTGETRGLDFVEGDPLFEGTSGSSFRVSPGSPAIDKGSATDAPAFDFEGTTRPQGQGYDIGAFER